MKLSKYEITALEELGRHESRGLGRARAFYWRRASMSKLADKGLVQRDTRYGSDAQPAWKMTNAGRDFLKGFPQP